MNNVTIFQFFHWYYSADGKLWNHAAEQSERLAHLGVTHVWLPPAYKSANGQQEPGYAVYDIFDLGEFDQKGTIPTRHGSKEEYLQAIDTIHKHGMQVIADIVLNHKHGADETEKIPVQKVNEFNRNEMLDDELMIDAWTKFTFPGRNKKYSDFVWDWHSFTGVSDNPNTIYLIKNEYGKDGWEEMLEDENGNFDYLMGCDIEFRNPNVREELKKWGEWYVDTAHLDGFRLDALKHISHHFYTDWLDHLNNH
ncbi:MAG: alpha-amylase family glycosyl hydrolase, partial [Chitinophagaceae bacterium]